MSTGVDFTFIYRFNVRLNEEITYLNGSFEVQLPLSHQWCVPIYNIWNSWTILNEFGN